jgi:23S rRNA (guanosine2251-2'-O)-methyltransferase
VTANPPGAVRIEGVRPVLEALRAGRRRVWRVELPEVLRTPGVRELREQAQRLGVPCSSGTQPLAWADPFPEESAEQLLLRDPVSFLVALDRVTDVGNLGSIARTAETAGCEALVLEHRHSPPLGEGALRASSGALEHLRIGRTPNLGRTLELLRAEGFVLLAAAPGGAALGPADGPLLEGKLAWIFGSEDRGIREGILRRADRIVGISLRGNVESLGVAAAAAFLLHRSAELRGSAGARGSAARGRASPPAESGESRKRV